jgi:sulfatase maturation enzyme AslB (radical SAM superfamily)
MCHPSNSSLIDKETQENEELKEFMGKKHYPVNDDLLPNICNKETFENLEVLKILGGEPTIDPQVTKLLEWTVGNGYAKDINLRFTTNATNMNKRWVEAVNQFKTCKIQISLDGTGPTYDYIRTGANWSKIKENTLRCPEMYNNIRAMGSNIVYSVYNCFTVDQWLPELKQIRREIKDQGINYEFNVINCTTPAHQKVSNLPDELKQVILDKIDALGFEDEVTHSIRTYTELPAVGSPSGHAIRFFKHNDILDRLRRTNIETLSPEYKQLREVSNA